MTTTTTSKRRLTLKERADEIEREAREALGPEGITELERATGMSGAACRHCGKPVTRCEGPATGVPCGWAGWVHYSRHGSHYCDGAERTTVAEPAESAP